LDTKIITAQNERTQKFLTSGLVIVDAAVEPLRVLKVLMEGLGEDVKAGLWLTNFRGVPVARTLSPFDLVYLDAEYRVVHCVEISTEGEYEPFRGAPASALVLPPKAIVASKTRPGDKLQFRAVDESEAPQPASERRPARRSAPAAPPPQPADEPAQPAHFFNSTFPVPAPQQVGAPLDQFLSAQTAKPQDAIDAPAAQLEPPAPPSPPPTPSGRLTKTARSAMGQAPTLRPAGDAPTNSQNDSRFYPAPVAPSVEPVGFTASAHIEHRMSSVPAPAEFVAPPPEAHQPLMPSGRLRRGVHLAPEPAPTTAPEPELPTPALPEPASHAQSILTQAAVPAAMPEELPEPPPKPAVVIPIKPEPAPIADLAPALPERAPAAPPLPMTAPAAFVPTPIPMVPIAEPAASVALAPVAKASPAQQPQRAQPRTPPTAPSTPPMAPLEIAPITQPPVRRPSTPSDAIVEAPLPAPAAAAHRPAMQIAADGVISPIPTEQPIPPRSTDLARTGPWSIEPAAKTKLSWDVKLLYALFPEFDPARPPEIRIPNIHDKLAAEIEDEDESPSRKLRILCWLYPNLHLDQLKQKRAEERRAPRLPMPGLVAYFFTGGSPRPHPIKDISVTGFYMQTDERWLPGTVIRVTLQMVGAQPDGARDSVTVLSRVVRWGPDGGGFEFVLPGFME
jgi:hypothetical protein